MMFEELFADMNFRLQEALWQVLPSNSFNDFIIANAFVIMSILAALIVIIILLVAFFMDFITDAWKVPFGAVADLFKYLTLIHPAFSMLSAAVGGFTFAYLSDMNYFGRGLFTAISVTAAFLAWFWADSVWGVLLAIAPLNTMMIVLATVLD